MPRGGFPPQWLLISITKQKGECAIPPNPKGIGFSCADSMKKKYQNQTARPSAPVQFPLEYKGVVYKRRVALPVEEAVRYVHDGRKPREDSQIFREIDFFLHRCRPSPKVFIAYDREAYAGIDLPDLRITFDTGLRWRDTGLDLRCGSQGRPLLEKDQILMELKIPGAAPLWLARLLSQAEAFPTSFSKYGTWYKQKISGCYAPGTIHKEEHICA